jgi:hypothetical protein
MVTVPVRCGEPVYGAAAMFTVPFPLPFAPLETVSHAALLIAIQLHEVPAVTLTLVVSPAAGDVRLVGEMAYVQGAAACVIVNVRPAIETVPVREVVAVFAATASPTLPGPEPLAPEETVTQGTWLMEDHPHPVPAVTVTEAFCAVAVTDWEVGAMA